MATHTHGHACGARSMWLYFVQFPAHVHQSWPPMPLGGRADPCPLVDRSTALLILVLEMSGGAWVGVEARNRLYLLFGGRLWAGYLWGRRIRPQIRVCRLR